jgi:hypothetical protein
MSNEKTRHQIAREAARLLFLRHESEYYRAKVRAARLVLREAARPRDLPSDKEIREELANFVHMRAADLPIDAVADRGPLAPDRFKLFETLLSPLEHVKESPRGQPPLDVLQHSLLTFELARARAPYDEELLLAALLHDVGKGLDRLAPIPAALEALDGHITDRTAWLIEHLPEGSAVSEGTLGPRPLKRLQQSEDYDDLLLLSECNRAARTPGAAAPDLDEALEYVRGLQDEWDS